MLESREFYLVMSADGAVLTLGDPAADMDGRFPNQETAEQAAIRSGTVMTGGEVFIVRHVRTVKAKVSGTTQVMIEPVDS